MRPISNLSLSVWQGAAADAPTSQVGSLCDLNRIIHMTGGLRRLLLPAAAVLAACGQVLSQEVCAFGMARVLCRFERRGSIAIGQGSIDTFMGEKSI